MRTLRILYVSLVAGVWLTSTVLTQAPINNPSGLVFRCPDHGLDDQHEVDLVRVSDSAVIQTLLVGDPPADASGDVTVAVNVQPVAFGRYVFVVRALAGALNSDSSAASPVWERAPGRPSDLRVK